MSSTNRSDARLSHKDDYYKTPIKVIQNFFNKFLFDENISRDIWILDPCCGEYYSDEEQPFTLPKWRYCHVLYNDFGFWRNDPYSTDIRYWTNYLENNDEFHNEYDMIVSNPPYKLAQEFCEKAISDVKDGWYVIFLLRLNFLESQKRLGFFTKYPPKFIYVHSKRISFTEDGKTDSCAYAHFVWQKGYTGEPFVRFL